MHIIYHDDNPRPLTVAKVSWLPLFAGTIFSAFFFKAENVSAEEIQ